jgi:polyphenol oxidase
VTEVFSYLEPIHRLTAARAAWIGRLPDLDLAVDRDEALRRLRPFHEKAVMENFSTPVWWRAEQVHGAEIAVVPTEKTQPAPDGLPVVAGVDGLVTAEPGQVLGIYVADCGAIWLSDRRTGAVGLLHSGKKGSELGILGRAVALMREAFGTQPEDLVGVLGPCIRPPHYEIDFAAQIRQQAAEAGIVDFFDSMQDTAADLICNYSYRIEKGHTGRMLALIQCPSRPC